MATTIKFTPSINIIRDSDFDFDYIVTPNTYSIFNQLFNDVIVGQKTHSIIGAYGIGKSAFLLAVEQTLNKKRIHFKGFEKVIKQLPQYEFVNVVGDYASIIVSLGQEFGVTGKTVSTKDVLKAIANKHTALRKKGKGLAIIIDEFGKFLEFATNHNPEAELYFIQQLAEFVNGSNNEMLFITALHQNVTAYSASLDNVQRQEWEKVSGRLKAITFNEPVEQLLLLASERLKQKDINFKPSSHFDKLFNCIVDSKAFPLREYLELEFAKKLLPFDILSAAVLALALQKYGQNERSLFSFIESNDYLGINEDNPCSYYSLPQVYNYLINNFSATINTTKNNSNFSQWSAIKESLEKIEGVIEPSLLDDAHAFIKAIGLLNIFSSASGRLDNHFYTLYGKLALGIKQPERIIKELEKYKLIKYTKHNFRYSLLTGTDVDIDLAIDEAGRVVEKVKNVAPQLNQHFDFPFIPAKAASYKKGTPRFFQFKLTEEPVSETPEGEVDGFINLVFSDEKKASSQVQEFSKQCKEAILYGHYTNTTEVKRLIFEIQKVNEAIAQHKNDKAAVREFTGVREHYKRLLNHYVIDSLYSPSGHISWYFRGEEQDIIDKRTFNQTLSSICDKLYPAVPTFRSDLINKTNISGAISSARKRLFEKLLANPDIENVGFQATEFPPEKSIYLTLLKNTGIHHDKEGFWQLDKPANKSFIALWKAGEDFLTSTKQKERNLQDFINILSVRPFKLKKGFIDFWLPLFLLIKNDEFALYESDIFIQDLSIDVLDLVNKKPHFFTIKAFDVSGIKLQLFNRYRILLNQSENNKPNSQTFIETIKPFVTFYRQLPDYSKQTNRLSKQAIALRQIITRAKDPEKTFFEDFPTAFGYSIDDLHKSPKLADSFIIRLQDCIKELRTAYDELVNRFENYLAKEVIGVNQSFPEYRNKMRKRFKNIRAHLLLPHQKPFITRLQSELDDRKAWLASIAQACINKPLTAITDEDELVLFDKLKDIVYELDNLCDISASSVNTAEEEVVKLEITSLVKGLNKSLLRISTSQTKEVEKKQQEIKKLLFKDKKINIAILTKLLQELLSND